MIERQDPSFPKSRAPAPAKAGAGRVSGRLSRGWRAVFPTSPRLRADGVRPPRVGAGSAAAVAAMAAVAVAAGGLLLAAGAGAAGAAGGAEGVAFLPYRDGPPPGFSGGFGEDTCQGCHFEPGVEVNEPGGSVTLAGVPESYEGGRAYPIIVTLTREGMRVAGFEMTARFAEGGAQAGGLTAPEDAAERVRVTTDRDVQYAHQRLAGSALAAPDTARWTVLWTAPAGGGAVVFDVAANAANEDDSSSGDYVYTADAKTTPGG